MTLRRPLAVRSRGLECRCFRRRNIIKCTEEEAFRTRWKLDTIKLDAFIALLYAHGVYQAKNLEVTYLWNKIWLTAYFSETVSRNDFAEIIRFIQFDKKSKGSRHWFTN